MKKLGAVVCILLTLTFIVGCETTDSGTSSSSGDPVGNFMIDLNHAVAPHAANQKLMNGDARGANQTMALDSMMQLMRTQ